MRSYRAASILTEKKTQSVGAGETVSVGKGNFLHHEQATNLRVRVTVDSLALNGDSNIVATIYHAPTSSDTLVTTGKTITMTADGDGYAIINESDTGIVPIMPYIEVKFVSSTNATFDVTKCDIFRV